MHPALRATPFLPESASDHRTRNCGVAGVKDSRNTAAARQQQRGACCKSPLPAQRANNSSSSTAATSNQSGRGRLPPGQQDLEWGISPFFCDRCAARPSLRRRRRDEFPGHCEKPRHENRPFFADMPQRSDDQPARPYLHLVATTPVGVGLAGVECITFRTLSRLPSRR